VAPWKPVRGCGPYPAESGARCMADRSAASCGAALNRGDRRTDGWQGYAPRGLGSVITRRLRYSQTSGGRAAAYHQVFGTCSVAARTHHGVSNKHLPTYLDEFTFRFQPSPDPMAAFSNSTRPRSQRAPPLQGIVRGGVNRIGNLPYSPPFRCGVRTASHSWAAGS